MTFEEIREMVNSTINENGLKQITGKTLNLALTETLAAIEEFLANNAGGGGLESVYLYEETLTPEQQAANAAVFAKAKAAYEAGQPLPGVQTRMPLIAAGGAGGAGYQIAIMVAYIAPDTEAATAMGIYGLIVGFTTEGAPMVINEDGTYFLLQ